MLFPELSCVCIPSIRPVTPCVFLAKVPHMVSFEYRKRCGHINILKTFPGDTDSKYIWTPGYKNQ